MYIVRNIFGRLLLISCNLLAIYVVFCDLNLSFCVFTPIFASRFFKTSEISVIEFPLLDLHAANMWSRSFLIWCFFIVFSEGGLKKLWLCLAWFLDVLAPLSISKDFANRSRRAGSIFCWSWGFRLSPTLPPVDVDSLLQKFFSVEQTDSAASFFDWLLKCLRPS